MVSSGQRGSCTGPLGNREEPPRRGQGLVPTGHARQGPGSRIKAAESFRERRAPHTLLPALVCYSRECPVTSPRTGWASRGRSTPRALSPNVREKRLFTLDVEQPCSATAHTQVYTCQRVYTSRIVDTHTQRPGAPEATSHTEKSSTCLASRAAPRTGARRMPRGVEGPPVQTQVPPSTTAALCPHARCQEGCGSSGEKPSHTEQNGAS